MILFYLSNNRPFSANSVCWLIKIFLSALFAFTIFVYRVQLCYEHGSQYPINDQWESEFVSIYKKDLEGNLGLANFFEPNNEHIIALQKAIHYSLFKFLGEWNTLAQMYLNAGLFSLLVFGIFLIAEFMPAGSWRVAVQAGAFFAALVPSTAENFLNGFQTGWYLYYLLSLMCLLGLIKSSTFDFYWIFAYCCAVLSCMCLASGPANLMLCLIWLPFSRLLAFDSPKRILSGFIGSFLLVSVPLGIVVRIALERRVQTFGEQSPFIINFWQVASYPNTVLPISILPSIVALAILGGIYYRKIPQKLSLSMLACGWAFAHALLIIAGRGGLSSRHQELLLLGAVANIAILPWICQQVSSFQWLNHFHKAAQIGAIIWISIMFGGLALQMDTEFELSEMKEDFIFRSYEVVKRLYVTGNSTDISQRDFHSGSPATILSRYPQLLTDSIIQFAMPGFFPKDLQLAPPMDLKLLEGADSRFAAAFPFLTWLQLDAGHSLPKLQNCQIEKATTPYLKIVWLGRSENPGTGIFTNDGRAKYGDKASFSQSNGWRTVFLPVEDRSVSFLAKVAGQYDWILIQYPIPCSKAQFLLELIGRQTVKIFSYLLFVCVTGLFFRAGWTLLYPKLKSEAMNLWVM